MEKANEGAKEFAILEEGMYNFVVKEPAKAGTTGKNHPKFTINPSVESGERANARVWHDFSITDSAYVNKTFFFGDLATLGLGPSFFETNPSPDQIAGALQGKRFVAQVVHKVGNDGKTRAQLENISTAVGAAPAAGVPGGLPQATGVPAGLPVAQAAPQVAQAAPVAAAAAPGPWDTVPQVQPAAPVAPQVAQSANIPLPPPFGN
jgi:hypothetical protein